MGFDSDEEETNTKQPLVNQEAQETNVETPKERKSKKKKKKRTVRGSSAVNPETGYKPASSMQMGGFSELDPDFQKALMQFDLSGDGKLSLEDLEKAAKMLNAANGSKNSYSFDAFPESIHHLLETFDNDGDRSVSVSELAAAARLFEKTKKQNKTMKYVIMGLVFLFLFTLLCIGGLVYELLEATKEANVGEGGEMRAKGNGKVVVTADTESFATLTDLPELPLKALDAIDQLTFTTIDNKLHSYQKSGVQYNEHVEGGLEIFFTVAGRSLRIEGDDVKLVVTTGSGLKQTAVVTPSLKKDELADRRRRLLDSHLSGRCTANGRACLHSYDEIHALHRSHAGRTLAELNGGTAGVSYASLDGDANDLISGSEATALSESESYIESLLGEEFAGLTGNERLIVSFRFRDRCSNHPGLSRCNHPVPAFSEDYASNAYMAPYKGMIGMGGVWYFDDEVTLEKDYATTKVTVRSAHDHQGAYRKTVYLIADDGSRYMKYDEIEMANSTGQTSKFMANCEYSNDASHVVPGYVDGRPVEVSEESSDADAGTEELSPMQNSLDLLENSNQSDRRRRLRAKAKMRGAGRPPSDFFPEHVKRALREARKLIKLQDQKQPSRSSQRSLLSSRDLLDHDRPCTEAFPLCDSYGDCIIPSCYFDQCTWQRNVNYVTITNRCTGNFPVKSSNSTCTDTMGFAANSLANDGTTFDCDSYASALHCENGAPGPIWQDSWTWATDDYGRDARTECCVCGKQGVTSGVLFHIGNSGGSCPSSTSLLSKSQCGEAANYYGYIKAGGFNDDLNNPFDPPGCFTYVIGGSVYIYYNDNAGNPREDRTPICEAPARCAWLATTNRKDMLECADGTQCNGATDGWACCNSRGGRAKCPVDRPRMCANANGCAGGTDYCCSDVCDDGDRICEDPTTTTTTTTTTFVFTAFPTNSDAPTAEPTFTPAPTAAPTPAPTSAPTKEPRPDFVVLGTRLSVVRPNVHTGALTKEDIEALFASTDSDDDDDTDPCDPNPFNNGGECLSMDSYPICDCKDEYYGEFCENEYLIDLCDPNPCLNGGTCVPSDSGVSCECSDQFNGNLCELEIDASSDAPHSDHSDVETTTMPVTTTTTTTTFVCDNDSDCLDGQRCVAEVCVRKQSCCEESSYPGCIDSDIERTACETDNYCCTTQWDTACVPNDCASTTTTTTAAPDQTTASPMANTDDDFELIDWDREFNTIESANGGCRNEIDGAGTTSSTRTTEATLAACKQTCLADSDCKGIEYNYENGYCESHTNEPTYIDEVSSQIECYAKFGTRRRLFTTYSTEDEIDGSSAQISYLKANYPIYSAPFGFPMMANSASDLEEIYDIFARVVDSNSDGCADLPQLVSYLQENQCAMVVTGADASIPDDETFNIVEVPQDDLEHGAGAVAVLSLIHPLLAVTAPQIFGESNSTLSTDFEMAKNESLYSGPDDDISMFFGWVAAAILDALSPTTCEDGGYPLEFCDPESAEMVAPVIKDVVENLGPSFSPGSYDPCKTTCESGYDVSGNEGIEKSDPGCQTYCSGFSCPLTTHFLVSHADEVVCAGVCDVPTCCEARTMDEESDSEPELEEGAFNDQMGQAIYLSVSADGLELEGLQEPEALFDNVIMTTGDGEIVWPEDEGRTCQQTVNGKVLSSAPDRNTLDFPYEMNMNMDDSNIDDNDDANVDNSTYTDEDGMRRRRRTTTLKRRLQKKASQSNIETAPKPRAKRASRAKPQHSKPKRNLLEETLMAQYESDSLEDFQMFETRADYKVLLNIKDWQEPTNEYYVSGTNAEEFTSYFDNVVNFNSDLGTLLEGPILRIQEIAVTLQDSVEAPLQFGTHLRSLLNLAEDLQLRLKALSPLHYTFEALSQQLEGFKNTQSDAIQAAMDLEEQLSDLSVRMKSTELQQHVQDEMTKALSFKTNSAHMARVMMGLATYCPAAVDSSWLEQYNIQGQSVDVEQLQLDSQNAENALMEVKAAVTPITNYLESDEWYYMKQYFEVDLPAALQPFEAFMNSEISVGANITKLDSREACVEVRYPVGVKYCHTDNTHCGQTCEGSGDDRTCTPKYCELTWACDVETKSVLTCSLVNFPAAREHKTFTAPVRDVVSGELGITDEIRQLLMEKIEDEMPELPTLQFPTAEGFVNVGGDIVAFNPPSPDFSFPSVDIQSLACPPQTDAPTTVSPTSTPTSIAPTSMPTEIPGDIFDENFWDDDDMKMLDDSFNFTDFDDFDDDGFGRRRRTSEEDKS